MTPQYGGQRIRRGLTHFMMGKGVSALAGFAAMLLIVRVLSIVEFAQYSVLVALTELFTALSGLGIAHAMMRFVPELYERQLSWSLRRFVGGGIALRSIVLLLVGLLAVGFSGSLTPLIGLESARGVFLVFLLVAVFRSTSHFLSQILESTLHQAPAQMAFALGSLIRFLGILYLAMQGQASLLDVIFVEVLADGVCMSWMLMAVVRVAQLNKAVTPVSAQDRGWFQDRIEAIRKLAVTGYLQHLVALPFGGNTNRMVGGHLFSASVMASFGFAQSLYEYVKRYLPAQLLMGIVRPVVVARFEAGGAFADAARTADRLSQLNLVILVAMVAPLLVAGAELLAAASAGKYGAEAAVLLVALLVMLALESYRVTIELLIHTAERYALLIRSNVILASSVFAGIGLFPWLGAVALPVANTVALLLANAWVVRTMRSQGFVVRKALVPLLEIVASGLVATGLGHLILSWGAHWLLAATAAGVLSLVGAGWMRRSELNALRHEMLSNGKHA